MSEHIDTRNEGETVTHLDSYPIVIDPVSQLISVRLLQAPATHKWLHLQKISPSKAHAVVPTSNQRCHFFTDSLNLENATIILTYDSVGAISSAWVFCKNNWEELLLTEEATGQPSLCPSVRFQFASLKDRSAFLSSLSQASKEAAEARTINVKNIMSLLRLIGRCVTPPRVVSVAADLKDSSV